MLVYYESHSLQNLLILQCKHQKINLDHIGIKNIISHQVPSLPAETIKAITTDPSFQSALATALSSIMGGDLKIDHNVTRNEAEKSP